MTPEQRSSFLKLIDRYLAGTATVEERAIVEQYDELFADAPEALDHLNAEQLKQFENNLNLKIKTRIRKARGSVVPMYSWKAVVALVAAIAVMVCGIWFFNNGGERLKQVQENLAHENSIVPGKNMATLTFGNGKTIQLSEAKTGVIVDDDKLSYNDGSVIQKAALSQATKQLTVSTPRGGTYQVTLPDGTRVWLNAATRLTYVPPINEHEAIRLVELNGEAYFEVFKTEKQPFVVKAKNLTTTVLGTHFNISAYDDEHSTKATLLEGSVKVSSSYGGTNRYNAILKPAEQAVVANNAVIYISKVDTDEAISWKNGIFKFESQTIENIMKQVSRWYDVEIRYKNGIKNKTFSGAISRYSEVAEVIKMLEYTGLVHFKIEGRRITVMP